MNIESRNMAALLDFQKFVHKDFFSPSISSSEFIINHKRATRLPHCRGQRFALMFLYVKVESVHLN